MTRSWRYRLLTALLPVVFRPFAFPHAPTPAKMRRRMVLSRWVERLVPYPWGTRIEDVALPRCRAEWIGDASPAGRVVLQLHGGGYTLFGSRFSRDFNARIAAEAGARVLGLDYRQGLDHPWPEPLEDAVDAWRYLLDAGHRPEDVVIAGESGGAHLTLCTLLALRDRGLPLPAGAIVVSPWSNLACDDPSIEENRGRDVSIVPEALRALGRWLARGRDSKSPEISPRFADLRGLPPLFVLVGEPEVLRDDARALRDVATAAGVRVRYLEAEGMPHAWTAAPVMLPEAGPALTQMAEFIADVTACTDVAQGAHPPGRGAR